MLYVTILVACFLLSADVHPTDGSPLWPNESSVPQNVFLASERNYHPNHSHSHRHGRHGKLGSDIVKTENIYIVAGVLVVVILVFGGIIAYLCLCQKKNPQPNAAPSGGVDADVQPEVAESTPAGSDTSKRSTSQSDRLSSTTVSTKSAKDESKQAAHAKKSKKRGVSSSQSKSKAPLLTDDEKQILETDPDVRRKLLLSMAQYMKENDEISGEDWAMMNKNYVSSVVHKIDDREVAVFSSPTGAQVASSLITIADLKFTDLGVDVRSGVYPQAVRDFVNDPQTPHYFALRLFLREYAPYFGFLDNLNHVRVCNLPVQGLMLMVYDDKYDNDFRQNCIREIIRKVAPLLRETEFDAQNLPPPIPLLANLYTQMPHLFGQEVVEAAGAPVLDVN